MRAEAAGSEEGFGFATTAAACKRVEVTGTSALPTGNYIPRQLDATRIVAAKN